MIWQVMMIAVPIPREEVVALRSCVHDTNGMFNVSFEKWIQITMTNGNKISFMIGPICLVPNWRIYLFVLYKKINK